MTEYWVRWKAERRFWENVKESGECWIWTGGTSDEGYGLIGYGGKRVFAHRFSYEIHVGPIPANAILYRLCKNILCVHPDHLFLGTRADKMIAMRRTFEQRFWRFVSKSQGCWQWTGPLDRYGYGIMSRNGRRLLAHRASYIINVGEIADGLLVCHHCDNPSCVRPDHLYAGTPRDNMLDKTKRGRGNRRRTAQLQMPG